jgi:hypothetical protein
MKNVKKIFGFAFLILALTSCRKEIKEPAHKLAGRNVVYIEIGNEKYFLKATKFARIFNRKKAGNLGVSKGFFKTSNTIGFVDGEIDITLNGTINFLNKSKYSVNYRNRLHNSLISFENGRLYQFNFSGEDSYVETSSNGGKYLIATEETLIINSNPKKKFVEGYYLGTLDTTYCFSCENTKIKIYFDCKY